MEKEMEATFVQTTRRCKRGGASRSRDGIGESTRLAILEETYFQRYFPSLSFECTLARSKISLSSFESVSRFLRIRYYARREGKIGTKTDTEHR